MNNNKNHREELQIDPENLIHQLVNKLNNMEQVQTQYHKANNTVPENKLVVRDFYDNFIDGKYSDLNMSLGKQEASIRYHSYKEIFRNGAIRLFYPLLNEINNAINELNCPIPINLTQLLGFSTYGFHNLNTIENSISYLLEFDFYLKARLTEISINDISIHAASILYNILVQILDEENMQIMKRANQMVEAYRMSLKVLIKVLNNHAHTVYKPMLGNIQK